MKPFFSPETKSTKITLLIFDCIFTNSSPNLCLFLHQNFHSSQIHLLPSDIVQVLSLPSFNTRNICIVFYCSGFLRLHKDEGVAGFCMTTAAC